MKNLILSLFLLYTLYYILNTSPAFAETACVKVYGGGQGFCLPTTTPTPTPASDTFPQVPSTTKGGLPVLSTPNQTTNPATGPEALALIPLLSSGVIGYLLRKRT